MAMKRYTDAINELSHALSIESDTKDAYKNRAECYRLLVDITQDEEKKKEYVILAETDEKKYDELNLEA